MSFNNFYSFKYSLKFNYPEPVHGNRLGNTDLRTFTEYPLQLKGKVPFYCITISRIWLLEEVKLTPLCSGCHVRRRHRIAVPRGASMSLKTSHARMPHSKKRRRTTTVLATRTTFLAELTCPWHWTSLQVRVTNTQKSKTLWFEIDWNLKYQKPE